MLPKPSQKTPYAKTLPKISGPYTSIYLIRHCHPGYDQKSKLGDMKMPLSPIGLKQRKLLRKKLNQIKLDKIYVSELVRSQQTAEDYAHRHHKRMFIDKRLNEVDWSEWYKLKYFNMSEKNRTKPLKKCQAMDKKLFKLQTQVRRLLHDMYLENKGKKIGLFCHGNLIRAMVTSILHTDVIGFLSLEIYQSSVTKLVIDKNGFIKINYINNIGHLPHRPNEDLFLAALNQ